MSGRFERFERHARLAGVIVLLGGACLPRDEAKERGAIYVHLAAKPASAERFGSRVDFERLTMVTSGDVIDCHSLFYVERPRVAVGVIDLVQPFTLEHRSLTDEECGVVGGFVNLANAVPFVDVGVSEAEREIVMAGGTAVVGSMHIVARLSRTGADARLEKRVDVLLHGVTGFGMILEGVPVPSGGRSDVSFELQLAALADELQLISAWDRDGDGTVETSELPSFALLRIRQAVTDKWVLRERSTTER